MSKKAPAQAGAFLFRKDEVSLDEPHAGAAVNRPEVTGIE